VVAIQIGPVEVSNELPFVLTGGTCAEVAKALAGICARLGIPLIYKSSYDKANRTSGGAARGVGMARGLAILAEVRARLGVPVLTDVHDAGQCRALGEAVDVLQIPALLCRETDLLIAGLQPAHRLRPPEDHVPPPKLRQRQIMSMYSDRYQRPGRMNLGHWL
jgi:2-dehydro-3-deoxyphosphooctonate aldolase (KDO 8-P synthase)